MKIRILIALFLVIFSGVKAQEIKVFWTNDSIQIGEQTNLVMLLKKVPSNFKFDPTSGEISCGIKHKGEQLWKNEGVLEILSFKDTTYVQKGQTIWKGTYTLTAWDSASYQFPMIHFSSTDSSLQKQAAPLFVGFIKRKFDDSIDEVKVVAVDDSAWYNSVWWFIIPLLVVIVGLYFWNKQKRLQAKPKLSLKMRTNQAIAALKAKGYWKQDKTAKHYIEFSTILRRFLSERYGLYLMERTTYETVLLLKTQNIEPEIISVIQDLLNESDLIKFGKMNADEFTIISSMNRLEEVVIALSPLEVIE